MAATKHTEEPWYEGARDGPGDTLYPVIFGRFGNRICNVDSNDQENPDANARRILACVNACEGIPTEHLEAVCLDWELVETNEEATEPKCGTMEIRLRRTNEKQF